MDQLLIINLSIYLYLSTYLYIYLYIYTFIYTHAIGSVSLETPNIFFFSSVPVTEEMAKSIYQCLGNKNLGVILDCHPLKPKIQPKANHVSATFKIYPESDHYLFSSCYHHGLNLYLPSPGQMQ